MKYDITTKCKLSEAIETETFEIWKNAEPSINRTFRGIVLDLREEPANASDSMRASSESVSNESDENELQDDKHAEQRI
jgi:hypothetical protein